LKLGEGLQNYAFFCIFERQSPARAVDLNFSLLALVNLLTSFFNLFVAFCIFRGPSPSFRKTCFRVDFETWGGAAKIVIFLIFEGQSPARAVDLNFSLLALVSLLTSFFNLFAAFCIFHGPSPSFRKTCFRVDFETWGGAAKMVIFKIFDGQSPTRAVDLNFSLLA